MGSKHSQTEVIVPSLGESVTGAQVGRWLVEDGAYVTEGQVLLELETDKVSMEVPSAVTGRLTIKAAAGEEVSPGDVLGTVEEGAEASSTTRPKKVSPLQKRAAKKAAVEEKHAEVISEPFPKAELSIQKIATTEQLPVREYVHTSGNLKREKLSPLRQAIARNLKTTQNEAAILSTFNEIDMSAVKEARNRLKESFAKRNDGAKLGYMSFFARAVCVALQDFPVLNAYLDGDEIVWRPEVELGIAIGAEQGLVVPVLHSAQDLSFGDIEHQIADYAERAKTRRLTRDDLAGATFTITNGGVFGSMLSTPLLGPKQTGVLGLHTIKDRPVAVDGKVEVRPIMYAALSYDHRLLDGRDAVRFLARIKELIEDPVLLMVDKF